MPSWNIHTAHVERLLREEGAARLGVRDVNAFLFGNFLPDIYVGYMVPVPVARLRDYRETHFADGGAIPSPNYQAFWDRFVAGCDAEAAGSCTTWCWARGRTWCATPCTTRAHGRTSPPSA